MMQRSEETALSERAQIAILACKQEIADAPDGAVVTIIVPASGSGLDTMGFVLQARTELPEVFRVLAPAIRDDDAEALETVAARVEADPGDGRIWIVVLLFDDHGLEEVDARRAQRKRWIMSKGGDA